MLNPLLPQSRPSLELLGESVLLPSVVSTLALDFEIRRRSKNGSAPHVIVLGASADTLLSAMEDLRGRTKAPTIVLLRDADLVDRIRAFEAGADEVLVAPFDAAELLARARALVRRLSPQDEEVLRVDDVEINLDRKAVRRGNRMVVLSRTEFALLTTLARHDGAVVSHDMLTREVWGAPKTKANVHTFVCYLRAKLEAEGESPVLRTIRGVGYALGSADWA